MPKAFGTKTICPNDGSRALCKHKKSWQKSGLYCVRAQTAPGPFLPDFYVFSNSQAQRHRVWAGSRTALNEHFALELTFSGG
jgi:hypothetical protein